MPTYGSDVCSRALRAPGRRPVGSSNQDKKIVSQHFLYDGMIDLHFREKYIPPRPESFIFCRCSRAAAYRRECRPAATTPCSKELVNVVLVPYPPRPLCGERSRNRFITLLELPLARLRFGILPFQASVPIPAAGQSSSSSLFQRLPPPPRIVHSCHHFTRSVSRVRGRIGVGYSKLVR